jgi:hypothetical protein
MKRLALFMLLLAAPVVAAQVQVTSNPPLPLPNLIVNGGIEQAAPDGAANWSFGTANPENFAIDRVAAGRSGPGALHLISHTGVMSGYFNQVVKVKPETDYLLRAWYRHGGGKLLNYAHAVLPSGRGVDQRFYSTSLKNHFLAPVFLKPEYIKGTDPSVWQLCRLPFRTIPEMNSIAISLGIFFSAGELWFDDVSVTEAATDLTVTVKGPATKVRVLDDKQAVLFDSGALNTDTFTKTLPGVPSDGRYTIEVTEPGGKIITQQYPKEAR